ncbi:MAG: CHAT domain-containing protein [Bacteroidota bacterium]
MNSFFRFFLLSVIMMLGICYGKQEVSKETDPLEEVQHLLDQARELNGVYSGRPKPEEVEQVFELMDSALLLLSEYPDSEVEVLRADCLIEQGVALQYFGNPEQAKNIYREVLPILEKSSLQQKRAGLLDKLASAYREMTIYSTGEVYALASKAQYEALAQTESGDFVNLLNTLGVILVEQSRFEEGLAFISQSIDIQERVVSQNPESLEILAGLCQSLVNLANIYQRMDRELPQSGYFELCLETLEQLRASQSPFGPLGYSTFLLHYWNTKGVLFNQNYEGKLAMKAFSSMEQEAEIKFYSHISLLNNRAFVQLKSFHKYDSALILFQEALATLDNSYHADSVFVSPDLVVPYNFRQLISLKGKATSLHRLADQKDKKTYLRASLVTYERALELIGKMRFGYITDQDKLALSEYTPPIYEDAIRVCMELFAETKNEDFLLKAFAFIHANKSTSLLDKRKGEFVLESGEIPPSIRDSIQAYELALKIATKKKDVSEIGYQYEQYAQFRKKLSDLYPKFAALLFGPKIPSLSSIQKDVLEDSEAIIEYFWGDTSLYCMVIRPDNVYLKELPRPDSSRLQDKILQFRESIDIYKQKDEHLAVQVGHQLYQCLLEPIAHLIKGKQIIIVPDRDFYHIPFEGLIIAYDTLPRFRTSRYVIEKYPVSYAPSTALFALYHEQKTSGSDSLLAFAPGFSDDMKEGFQKQFQTDQADQLALFEAYLTLPEQKKVVELLSQNIHSWGGRLLLEEKANRLNFSQLAPNARMILLGTHAVYQQSNSLPSWIAMGFDPQHAQQLPMLLEEDIYSMTLQNELVVLMACETGLGKLKRGEGSMSLARAFLYAGSETVVQSLWSIPEGESTYLVKQFMEQLQAGETKADALRKAKLAFLADPFWGKEFSNPYHWAGLILIGDPKEMANNQSSRSSIAWIAFFIFLLIAGLIYFQRFYQKELR